MANTLLVVGGLAALYLVGRRPSAEAATGEGGTGFAGGGGGVGSMVRQILQAAGITSEPIVSSIPAGTGLDTGMEGGPSAALVGGAVVGGAPGGNLIEETVPDLATFTLVNTGGGGFNLAGDQDDLASLVEDPTRAFTLLEWGGPLGAPVHFPGGVEVLVQSLLQHGPVIEGDDDGDGQDFAAPAGAAPDPFNDAIDAAIAADPGFYDALDFEDLEFADE